MQTKIVNQTYVIYARKELSISEIGEISAIVTKEIVEDITRLAVEPSGNWIYVHYNLPKNGSDKYFVEFCLPIIRANDCAFKFPTKMLNDFPCAYTMYSGKLRSLFTRGVQPLVNEMKNAGLLFTGESREVYHNWVGAKSNDNTIEIQFGTQS